MGSEKYAILWCNKASTKNTKVMKKLIISLAMLLIGTLAFSQTYYAPRPTKRDVSYQVGAAMMSYNDYSMYGFSVGVNYKERVEAGFFHVRDYVSKEAFMDTRWGGWYATVSIPANDCIAIGPVIRLAKHDNVWQAPYVGGEVRFDLSWNVKLGIEYGKGEATGMGVKLIWNLY